MHHISTNITVKCPTILITVLIKDLNYTFPFRADSFTTLPCLDSVPNSLSHLLDVYTRSLKGLPQ